MQSVQNNRLSNSVDDEEDNNVCSIFTNGDNESYLQC